jgi:hypothetical protein
MPSRILIPICVLAVTEPAFSGEPIALNDRQMDAVSAGAASAATALQSVASGSNAKLSSMIANTAVDLGSARLAQSRGNVLARGTSINADIYSISNANESAAISSAGGAASGQHATLRSIAMTTAVSAAPFGSAQALSSTSSFSSSGSR